MRALFPRLVLGVGPDASDEDLRARYHDLVKRYPPDESPEEFAVVAAAYEAIRERRRRLTAEIFWMPGTGDAVSDLAWWLARAPRKRDDLETLRSIVADSLDD